MNKPPSISGVRCMKLFIHMNIKQKGEKKSLFVQVPLLMIHLLMNRKAEALKSTPVSSYCRPDIKDDGHEMDVFGNEAVIKPISLCRINTKTDERSYFTFPNPMNIYIHKRSMKFFPKQAISALTTDIQPAVLAAFPVQFFKL